MIDAGETLCGNVHKLGLTYLVLSAAGDHTLTLQWQGAPDGVANPQVGIDFVWVQRK